MKPKMTKKEIVEETLAYYEKDPERRAIHPETKECMYNLKDKGILGEWNGKYKHCAVGRCLDKKYKMEGEALPGNSGVDSVDVTVLANKISDAYSIKTEIKFDDLLDPKYKGHEIGFWKELQQLHDRENLWVDSPSIFCTTTSNKLRKEKVEIILNNYPDGDDE